MACIESQYIPYEAQERLGRGKAIIFAPHPDDEILGCCGAIMQHLKDGDPLKVVIVTDGAFGRGDDVEDYALTRRQETLDAAKVLGYEDLLFWDLPDRGVICDDELVRRVGLEIDAMGAEWVYAPSWWEIHPDHSALSRAVTQAVKERGNRLKLVLYEVGVPLHANVLLDITEIFEAKRQAIGSFKSQLEMQPYDRHILALNEFRSYTLPSCVFAAEAYRVVTPSEIINRLEIPWMSRALKGKDE